MHGALLKASTGQVEKAVTDANEQVIILENNRQNRSDFEFRLTIHFVKFPSNKDTRTPLPETFSSYQALGSAFNAFHTKNYRDR